MTGSPRSPSAHACNGPRRQRGLSLVELMIALTLGLVVVAGVSQVFVSTNAASRTQAAIVTLQENGRFASERLKPIGRLAGRMAGCVVPPTPAGQGSSGNVIVHLAIGADASLALALDPTVPVVAWNFTGTSTGQTYTLDEPELGTALEWQTFQAGVGIPAELEAIKGSDVIVMKRARAIPNLTACPTGNSASNATIDLCDEAGTPKASEIARGSIALVTDCTGYDLFQNTAERTVPSLERSAGAADLAPGNVAGGNWFSAYTNTMQVLAVDNFAYFVGIGQSGEPALFEFNLGSGTAQELIEGVESMQIVMGELDLATNQVIYRDPQDITDARLVMSARIALLMRAPGPDQITDSETYELAGVTVDPMNDTRLRKVFEVTMNMRNNGALL